MNDLEEFLNSIGAVIEEAAVLPEEVIPTEELNHADEPVQASNNLSEDDFNDILSDIGFQYSSDEQDENNSSSDGEDEEEIYDENQGEGREADEEDAEGGKEGQ